MSRKENERLFWDLTGGRPAGNYVREASGGNCPNACIGNKSKKKKNKPTPYIYINIYDVMCAF